MTTTTHDPNAPHGGVDLVDDEDTRPRRDPLDVLTIAELDAGSRQLGASLVAQVTNRGDRYERALAVVLWLHLRRTDRRTEPGALLKQLTALTFVELSNRLDELAVQLGATDDEQEGDDGPLESAPA